MVRARALALGGAAALAGLIALGPAAAADVNLSPAQAPQGGAAEVTLQVRNDRPGVWTTQVEVQFPEDTPIAEVYPMSVDDWAPIAKSRELDEPLDGIHTSGLTTITSGVTWIRAKDAPEAPAVENLPLQLGPLPEVDKLVLTVLQTYSDGKVERWSGPSPAADGAAAGPGTVLTLQPAAAAAAAGEEEAVTPVEEAEDGNTAAQLGLIVAGILAGVLISALVMVTIGAKNRGERPSEPVEEKADVVG